MAAFSDPATSSERAEIEQEQRYVDRVYDRLAVMVARATEVGRDGRDRGLLDYTGEIKEEDYRSLFERDVLVDHAVRRLAVLDAQREGLVFGRLDHRGGEIRYVGRIGVRDAEHEPLVIDWRAPAAAVFYQATAADPKDVVRRRILRCQGQRVVGVEDDLLDPEAAPADLPVVGDGALMAALTAARGRQMRDIVATIQHEQDEIIRAPSPGVTLISGGPGTGKTVVALHRAAYLLYSERRRIAGGGVLVVGPSPVFMSYIERVLPTLGEHEATLRSLGEVVDGIVATRTDPFDVGLIKGSLRMRRVLGRAARGPVPGAPEELRIYVGGRILRLDAEELAEVRRTVLQRGARRNRARGDAVRGLVAALWRKASADSTTANGRGARSDFEESVTDLDTFEEFVDAWWPVLTPVQVLRQLADPERLRQAAKGVLRPAEVDALTATWAGGADAGKDGFSVEDVPLLDELHALLGEPPHRPAPRDPFEIDGVREVTTAADRDYAARARAERATQYDGYAHVLVDEAQDLSPMQWRMLGRRGRHASWTVVGDPAQSSWPDIDEAEASRDTALGRRTRRTFHLSTNYRNSQEIFDLAASVIRPEIPDRPLPRAVRATGHAPDHVVATEAGLPDALRRTILDLLASVQGTVGVIAPQAMAETVSTWVADANAANGANGSNGSTGGERTQTGYEGDRVVVTTGIASKGLEFDAVALLEPAEIAAETPVGTRTLYVALTRATQRLATVGTDAGWPAHHANRRPDSLHPPERHQGLAPAG
ncbi:UvrD-helicase domain-containing protein [Actinopolymorpha sp. B11F2]|uniref:HelD family protein n=1 Tax=Actinopolymorpha sp. B11F2 TaxID=3160862 RepID=UPI0032E530EA